MIYSDMDPLRWAQLHGLSTMPSEPCPACKKAMPKGRAFLMSGYAGLEFRCPCAGQYSVCYKFVPVKPEKIAFWHKVLGPPPPPEKPKRRLRSVK